MAISSSLSVSAVRSSSSFIARSHHNHSKLSSISSLQFPARAHPQLRTTWISSPSSTSRRLPLLMFAAKEQTFDELLEKSDKPVLVDFYAIWSGKSQLMARVFNEVGNEMKDTIQAVRIDAEKYPAIADKYNIDDIPTYILFKDGKPCDRIEGITLRKDQFIQRIKNKLNGI